MKSIINFRNSIIALLMIVFNSAGALASAPWTVNPGDYRYDMTVYLKVMLADGEMDYSNYVVAVFAGEQCHGIAEVLPLPDGKSCLYLRARSNQTSEELTFKYYDNATGRISSFDNVKLPFEADSRLGYPSDPYVVNLFTYYNVNISAGNGGHVDNAGGQLPDGSVLTVNAVPDDGYHFVQWSDGVTDNPRIIVADMDYDLVAQFAPNMYTLLYVLDGENYKEYQVEYGATIIPEAAPEKEGYTFSGWQGVPETMPAHDVTVSGSFSINSYTATFKIGEEVIKTMSVVFGQPVVAPEAPEKEGHTFAGWQNVPETMPAHDIVVLGSYTVNSYKLTYLVDGESYKELTVEYGATITPEAAPEKEGYTFTGWQGVPETMPAHDVTVTGSFSINSYTATFKIGEEVIKTMSVVFGQPVVAPEAPEKEGHTFAGWQNVPETMPAHDIVVLGSYTVNSYKLTYLVDGESYKELTLEYGAAITPEAAPEKEGYTFTGWQGVPETMPAHDVTVTGSFTLNYYTLSIYLNDELYSTESVAFGTPLEIEEPQVPGMDFVGWVEDIPETMPAHDLNIHGILNAAEGVSSLLPDDDAFVTIYTISGTPVCRDVLFKDARQYLEPGLYIINRKKVCLKK